MTYPLSSTVSAGQPTAAEHYNNLRKDAINLGQSDSDVVNLGKFLNRYAAGIKLETLATNRVRVPYSATRPPTLMINGCMLQATANVDLPAGLISGSAATWYIFAVRSEGSSTFTVTTNTSASEATDMRLIGQAYWNGSSLGSIVCYLSNSTLPNADYDSGWFACTYNTIYTHAHGLGSCPRVIVLYHSTDSAGASEWVPVHVVQNGNVSQSPISCDSLNVYIQTGVNPDYNATCFSTRRNSLGGYYRLFVWA
jgi:hypothetical protein